MPEPIDVFARRPHFVDHLAPVWKALGDRQGKFYVPDGLQAHAQRRGLEVTPLHSQFAGDALAVFPPAGHPVVVCAYKDFENARQADPKRKLILMEHGAGFTFGNGHTSYAGGKGLREHAALFLCPNEYAAEANGAVYPEIPNAVVGCPKLDAWHSRPPKPRGDPPVVAVSFHWQCRIAPEMMTGFLYYKKAIPQLARHYRLIGHGHPRYMDHLRPFYKRIGIPIVEDFEEVMEQADLYINDCSSTLYEFASLDRPVVVLNIPAYRRSVNFGLRFWEHADVGINCNSPADLESCIERALQDDPEQKHKRMDAVEAAYPVRGNASQKAIDAILECVDSARAPETAKPKTPDGCGLVYIAFGEAARIQCRNSLESMRKVGCELLAVVVGDGKVPGADWIEWKGEDPFDAHRSARFQFLAGRIKPSLFALSPFQRTLYIDCDTEFLTDPSPAFHLLDAWEMLLTKDAKKVGELINPIRRDGGWKYNLKEKDLTIREIGTGEIFLWNSGVIFWRRCPEAGNTFVRWGEEWLRFAQWDEQLALLRAIYREPLKVLTLPEGWNAPHRDQAKYIFHEYGRGKARSDAGH